MIKHKIQSWKYIIPIVLIVLVICLCFYKTILITLGRFFNGEFNDSIASSITTGRTDIWKQYFKELSSSPWKMLFGCGIFATEIVAIGAHNTYIAILYRFGFLGVVAIGGLLFTYYFECKNLHFSLYNFLPMAFLFVYALQEVIIDERFLFLVLAIMLLFKKNNDSIDGDTVIDVDQKTNKTTYNEKVKMKVSKKK
jgi:O-antigen ligase